MKPSPERLRFTVATPPGGVRWTLPRDADTWLAVLAQVSSAAAVALAWLHPFGARSGFLARTVLAIALTLAVGATIRATRRFYGPRRAILAGFAGALFFGAVACWFDVLASLLSGHEPPSAIASPARYLFLFGAHPALILGLAAAIGWRRNAVRLEVLLDTLLLGIAAVVVGIQVAYFTAPAYEMATAPSLPVLLLWTGAPIAEVALVALLFLSRAETLGFRAARGIALGTLFIATGAVLQGRVAIVSQWAALRLSEQLLAVAVFSFASALHAGPTIARFYDAEGTQWIPYVRSRFLVAATTVAAASMLVLGFRERRSPELAIAVALFVLLLAVRAGRILVLQDRQAQHLANSVQVERALATSLEQRVAERTGELAEAQRVLQRMWILGQQVTLELHPGRVLQRFMEAVLDIAQADGGALGLLAPEGDIRVAAAIGLGQPLAASHLPVNGSALGHVVRTGALWTCDDIVSDPGGTHPLEQVAGAEGVVRGMAVLPIERRGERIGALMLVSRRARRFGEADLARIQSMTDMLSVALANAELVDSIRRAESRFRTLFRAAPDAVFAVRADGVVHETNDRVRALTGVTPDEMPGRLFADFVVSDDRGRVEEMLARAAGGAPGRAEVRIRRGDATRIASLAASHVPDADPPTVLLVARDITDERELMDHLAASERRSAVGELIGGVAHEVNNPLSTISAYAQLLLRDDQLTERQREAASIIDSETVRASHVVRDLLTFAGRSQPERQATDINQVVERAVRLRAPQLAAAHIAVETDFAGALPLVQADERQLQQALLNLVTNALQAMAPLGGGTLRLVTRADGDLVRIDVADTGPGIPPGVRARVFEPFFTTRPQGEGMGLGLSVSQGIITAHGGTLELIATHGHGAAFRLLLPAVAAPSEATAFPFARTPGAAPPAAPAPSRRPDAEEARARGRRSGGSTVPSPLSGLRLLFVDDEPLLRAGMAAFGRQRGFDVVTADSGLAALDAVRAREFDAVVCDVRMPGMDGVAFHDVLRRERPALASRTVFVTGDVVGTNGRFAVTRHQPTLSKPFAFERLEQALLEVLQAAASGD